MRVMSEVEAYIRQAAIDRGINPDVAVTVARREGGLNNPTQQSYARKNGIREPSYGPFQMLVGGTGTGYPTGLGNSFVAQTGMHPSNPDAWKAGVDFALDNAKERGWGAWYGAKAAGITGFKGIDRAAPMGIMQAINVPTPQQRPDTGLLASVPVERRELPAPSGLMSAYQPFDEPTAAQAAIDDVLQTQPQQESIMPRTSRVPDQVSLDTLRQPAQGLLSIADQYASYGAGKAAPAQAGLLSEDVAYQRMIDAANAQKQRMQAGIDPMEGIPKWTAPAQPQTQVQQPAVTQVQAPEMASQPIAQPAQEFAGGLLSPQEQQQFEAQRAFLSKQPTNKQKSLVGKDIMGALGGGLLGGLALGPLGGLLGAALGKSALSGRLNTMITGFPTAPSRAGSTGNTGRISRGQLNDNGRNAYNSSEQFREAVDKGSVGLY